MNVRRSDAIVVGAGAAGLAAARELGRRGCSALVLDRSQRVGESWRRRYDRLRLNTPRRLSGLPGRPIPVSHGQWCPRDDFADYLENYVGRERIDLRLGVAVERIEAARRGWRVKTAAEVLEAPVAVVATGFDHTPVIPDWPGREAFPGMIVHAAEYRNAEPFRGVEALIVGPGASGNEIAVDLREGGARSVRVAVRTPPHVFPRAWLGIPSAVLAQAMKPLPAWVADPLGALVQRTIWGDLRRYGLGTPPEGIKTTIERRGHGIAVDGGMLAAVRRGEIEIVAAFERFDGAAAVLADGTRLEPDLVVAATGYRRGLEPLVGHLGVLRDDGRPKVSGAAFPTRPGLFFIGYSLPVSGQLPEIPRDARRIGRAAARVVGRRQPER